MKNVLLLIVGSGFLAAGLQSGAHDLLATTNRGELVEIDLAAGTATLIGDAGIFKGKDIGWTGLSFDAAGDLFAVSRVFVEPPSVCLLSPFNEGRCAHLYRVDPINGAILQEIGDTRARFVSDIDFASGGTLYGNHFHFQGGALITLNLATAIANEVGPFGNFGGLPLKNGALSIHPITGEIWAVESSFALDIGAGGVSIFRVDATTGAAIPPIVQLGLLGAPTSFGIDALEILPNGRFIATRGRASSQVYEINPIPDAISGFAEITLIPLVLDEGITGSLNGLESLTSPLDHFKCYEAEGAPVNAIVDLEDQFGPEPQVLVGEPKLFCNPVDKNGEGIGDPTAHLTCYEIDNGEEVERVVTVNNQFGFQELEVEEPELLCVPSEKIAFETVVDD